MPVYSKVTGCVIMQTAENSTVSLRAIDGRLASLRIVARHADSPDGAAAAAALTGLLDAAGAGISTEIRVSESATDAASIVFEALLPGGVAVDGITITRLRSFYPVVRSQLPGLDLALVAAKGPGIDDASLDAACRYARRFGRRRIDVVAPSQGVTQVLEDVDRRLDDWRERYPELEFATVPVARLIGEFAAGKSKVDVVVAPPVFADILEEVASVLSGAAGLATVSRFENGVVSVSADVVDGDVPPAAALILSIADLLVWLGRADVSVRIVNGWARTLEHGCHTGEFRVMSPYSRKLDACEFATVVASRLNDTPRTLVMRQPGNEPSDRPAASGHLRLVRS